tara:strand:- start:1244 stop:1843 length:600 start_codon:yes stop_codon:yes gene_type:complete
MAKYERHREFEVHLLSYDGAQHLRLHGWLKRNDVLIKSETIHKSDDSFGRFMIFINDVMLEKLKLENMERGLFCDIDVMNGESERWGLIRNIEKESEESKRENLIDKIQDFMFSFQIRDRNDIENFLKQANETSLTLFKQSKSFIDDYIQTKELTYKDKIKDIDLMIEAFVEEERYEDCALLVGIKEDIKEHYKLKKQL